MAAAGVIADVLVVLHFAFIVFVVLGGLLVWRWRRVAWLHVPAALWGAAIEFVSGVCPLTPLENQWRVQAGESGYPHSFIEQYLAPLIYPAGLTPSGADLPWRRCIIDKYGNLRVPAISSAVSRTSGDFGLLRLNREIVVVFEGFTV